MSYVQKRVEEHYDYVDNWLGPSRVLVFTALQGSQNYGLDDQFSDVDTKSVIVPEFRDLVFANKRLSTTLNVEPTIEHADVKDLREMVNCWFKQNINFMEVIYTHFYKVNPDYKWYHNFLYLHREEITHLNRYAALRAMHGNLLEKYHAFDHPYPNSMEKINKFGYDPKQLHHQMRFKEFLERYFQDEPYGDILTPRDPEYLKAVKRGCIPLEEARVLREEIKEWGNKFLEEWKPKLVNEEDQKIVDMLNEATYQVFKQANMEVRVTYV